MAFRALADRLTGRARTAPPSRAGVLRPSDPRLDRYVGDQRRLANYARFRAWYDGYLVRGLATPLVIDQYRRISFNFCKPIIKLAAGWLAAKPLVWDIRTATGVSDEGLSETAKEIWDRSGAERTFLDAVIAVNLYGDGCLLVVRHEEGPSIEFQDPGLCFPVFAGSSYQELIELEIVYQVTVGVEQDYLRREIYEPTRAVIYHDDEEVAALAYEALPAVWVRNDPLPGLMFGNSDLDGIVELVGDYDHLARKQTQIVDYYASPRVVFEGVVRADLDLDVDTALYLPRDSKAYFLEWSGGAPDIEAQLTRIRNAIAEVSQIPAVAFGQMDRGFSSISGIGLQILYGPLLDKVRRKQAAWGPALERAMWLALMAEGIRLPIDRINLIWPDPKPGDLALDVQREAQAVEANLHSRETAMRAIGIEDPAAELAKIQAEQALLTPPELQGDTPNSLTSERQEGEEDGSPAPNRRQGT